MEYIPCYSGPAEHWGPLPATRLASRKILVEQNIKKRTGLSLCVLCGPISESMYTACSTHLRTGLACTLSITREYMEHGGRLPANCALAVYYLPVYPPYCDYNYGLWAQSDREEAETSLAIVAADPFLLLGESSTIGMLTLEPI